jgi:phytoene dehydrogenase-like protein
MPEPSVIIIGAGIAGLSTGCYGRMNGYRTRILEHDAEPGGVAKAWKHDGYLIDGGIHYLMGHRPGQACYQLYRELGILHHRRYPDLNTFVRFTDEHTGQRVSFTADLDRLARDLKALAPEDARLIDDFIAGIRAMQRTDMFGLMETPPELLGPFGPLKLLWRLRRSLRYLGGTYNRPSEQFAQAASNPALRRVLTHLFLPEVPAWFVLLLLALLASRQLGLLAGSCADFTASLVERYQGLGGEISYNATVKEILVEHHRAVGVRLADGSEHRADVVVSAGDGRSTLFELLGGRYLSPKLKRCYQRWKPLCPILTLSFGVRREFPNEPPLNFVFFKSPITIGGIEMEGMPVRLFNYGAAFAPPGKTVVQVLLLADWEFWNELRHDREGYDAEKNRVGAEILARLEPHYPGLTSQVELTDIATPYTTWRYTLNHHGAFMGWSPTPQALRTPLPKTLPGLDNFYMAGQWVMPGGGVPPCLYSGRHVIQMLCRRHRKSFHTSVPAPEPAAALA